VKTYNFNWEIRTLLVLFERAINDILIYRYDPDRAPQDKINVNLRYSQKSRTISDIVNKNNHIQLPVVAYWMTGIQRDVSRVFNNIEGSYSPVTTNLSAQEHLLQPLPIIINVSMSILARFEQDIDQILDNFCVWFDPYIILSHKLPYFDQEVRTAVKWSENIGLEYPIDISNNQPYRLIANTNFEIHGWLYKPPQPPTSKIFRIDNHFTAVSAFYNTYKAMENMAGPITTDYQTISARPFIFKPLPFALSVSSNDNIVLFGDMFQYTSAIYIIPTPNVYPNSALSYFDPFSSYPYLSATYPGFSAIKFYNWYIENEKAIVMTLDSATSAGYIDVIVENDAGYGRMSQDCISKTINPYISGTSDYNNWTAYQVPWLSGINILDKV
jgi:hypothetical protein